MPGTRVRRTPSESRRRILDAATDLLADGGVGAVEVREVARRVGMTDAGINHHFGGREDLLRELIRHGARKLRGELSTIIDEWVEEGPDVPALVRAFARAYDDGLADLAVALHAAGWRDENVGFLDPVVDAMYAHRRDPGVTEREIRLTVAAFHQAVALDTVYGDAFRRSAGLEPAGDDDGQLGWWTDRLEALGDRTDRGRNARTV